MDRKATLYIRWLGAFRRGASSLHEALAFELSRNGEVACEWIPAGAGSYINHARVGLRVRPQHIVKRFHGDCWSEYRSDGRLVATRNPRPTRLNHWEAWADADCGRGYCAIVVQGPDLPKTRARTVLWFARERKLPVVRLRPDGGLVDITRALERRVSK